MKRTPIKAVLAACLMSLAFANSAQAAKQSFETLAVCTPLHWTDQLPHGAPFVVVSSADDYALCPGNHRTCGRFAVVDLKDVFAGDPARIFERGDKVMFVKSALSLTTSTEVTADFGPAHAEATQALEITSMTVKTEITYPHYDYPDQPGQKNTIELTIPAGSHDVSGWLTVKYPGGGTGMGRLDFHCETPLVYVQKSAITPR